MSPVIDQTVRAGLLRSGGRVQEIPAVLRYRRTDPLAVRVCFPPRASLGGTDVAWVFGRDLLASGLHQPAGEGDVRVRPSGGAMTVLEFHTSLGTAMVRMTTADLYGFLQRSYGVVPPGSEHLHLDLDRDLADLLREA
ncbi:SsgA family sporulation/cell division regulator [Streptomyces sp. KR80]|uniref:SsgA family sporulation/cell division regulator n=1 Tax=Streptomyces sp. KR80 TaxID=3457426 RepID=UPI003FD5D159